MGVASLNNDRLLELVGSIYAAAIEPCRWTDTVEQARVAFQCSAAAIYTASQDPDQGGLVYSRQITREDVASHARLAPNGPSQKALVRRGIPQGLVYTWEMLFPLREMYRSEIFNELMKPRDVYAVCNTILFNGRSGRMPHLQFNVIRGAHGKAIGEDLVRSMRILTPHLQRAIAMNRDLGLRAHAQAVRLAEIEHLDRPVLLLNGQGRVVFANRPAEALLLVEDGLAVREGRLVASRPEETARLHQLVGASTQAARDYRLPPTASVTLPRPSGAQRMTVRIAPLPLACDFALAPEVARAILFVDVPLPLPEHGTGWVARTYRLTPAEARILVALADGFTPKEIAAKFSIRHRTVTTHLSRLYSKTGTRRQAELVRLVLSGATPPGSRPIS